MSIAHAHEHETGINTLEELRALIPDTAKDIRINLSSVLNLNPQSGLTESQIWGIALSSAYATRHPTVIAVIKQEAADILTAEEMQAAESAATVMAMNNIYYRFVHLVSDKEYQTRPAGLRMNVIGQPGIEKRDFELYALAVSALNGCGMCMDAHVQQVEAESVSKDGIQHTIRIAAVLSATAQALIL